MIGAIYVIMNGFPAAPLDVGERVLWFALGSLGGVVLMAAAYARDAPPRDPERTPLAAVVARGARQVGDAIAHDRVLRGHALRLATIVALTILVATSFDLVHGYWIPLTILAVLQPDEHASSVRAVQRGMGTLIGTAVIALVTVHHRGGVAAARRAGLRRLRPLRAVLARLLLARRPAHADGAAHDQRRRLPG